MRTFATLFFLGALCVPCFGQASQRPVTPELQLVASGYGTHFVYSISRPEAVREAWVEILDRPLLLAKKSVAVQANGILDWQWDRSELNFYEQPEDNLVLSVWDPNGESIFCVGTTMYSQRGGVVSSTTVGGRERVEPSPRLDPSLVRAGQGADAVTFDVSGQDLRPNTRFHVTTKFHVAPLRAGKCDNKSMSAQVVDLAHARITLGPDCLQKAGILLITAEEGAEDGATVHVASRTSPVLSSVSPATIPGKLRQDKIKLVLRGHGFTEESKVYAGYNPDAGDYSTDQLYFETEYVSPTELRVHVDLPAFAPHSETVDLPEGENLRIWVKGREEKFELSEARDVTLQSTGHRDPLTPHTGSDFRRWLPKTAVVTSVSPFPIKLMNAHSPAGLKVTILGQNFVPEDKVWFAFGNQATNDKEVRTEYVSPSTLHAWLPRQFWRKHALSYRLVIVTTEGQHYVRQVDEKGDQ